MTIEDLILPVENFNNELLKIKSRRQQWADNTKLLIKETLSEIKKKFSLDWNVYVMDSSTNSEGVNISFGKSNSGIVERRENGMKSFVKTGGTLAFSQAYNGDIFVIILYPSVEELVSPIEQKLVVKVNPNKIDKEFIYTQASNFLREMALWESSSSDDSAQ